MKQGLLFLLPVASALLLTGSLPPFELGFLAWFGLSPLFFGLRQKGPVAAASLAYLYGFFFFTGTFFWACRIPGIGLPKFVLVIAVLSLYFFLFGLLYRLLSVHVGSWMIVAAPALWVGLEYTQSSLFFLSMPWNLVGHSQYRCLPVIQMAGITGVYGISFLVVMTNQFLSQTPDFFRTRRGMLPSGVNGAAHVTKWRAQALTLAFAWVLTLSYGCYKLAEPESGKHVRLALVQTNTYTIRRMPLAKQVEYLQGYERLTKEASLKHPDLIVWPASSLPESIHSRLVRLFIRQLPRETGTYLLVGGTGHDKSEPPEESYLPYSNTEFLISPAGRIARQYDKMRLLPFNEYLPLQGKITWPEWITTLKGSFIPGEEFTVFEVAEARFGTPICWENMFPGLFRRFVREGANLMVSVTNEAFMGYASAPYYQALAINVFRAVENRVAIARAGATGVSAFISPDGEIVERVRDGNGNDLFVAGVLVRDVPLSTNKTFYTLYGDVFTYVVICMAGLIIAVFVFRRKWSGSQIRS
jgi:apolipoprotein N-acyltransferase